MIPTEPGWYWTKLFRWVPLKLFCSDEKWYVDNGDDCWIPAEHYDRDYIWGPKIEEPKE